MRFQELALQAEHVLAVQHLPWIHCDPYCCAEDCVVDRLLLALAPQEGLHLFTIQRVVVGYGEAVRWAG